MASTEAGDPTVRPLVQYMDFTMDADVRALITLKQEEERLMNDMYNTSPIVMGTQQTYTGYGTQQSAISQATMSIVNDTQTHVQFLANVLQYSVNAAKKFYTSKEGKSFAKDLFSERTIYLMEQSEDLRFEDLSTIVDILDNIDQVERKELMMLAQTIIPTGNLAALELMVDLQSQPTKTSLKNAISYIINKQKREQQQQQEQQMMQQAIMQDSAGQQMMEREAMIQDSKGDLEAMKADAMLEKEAMKLSASQPPSQQAPQ
jgi:hypothetical protein